MATKLFIAGSRAEFLNGWDVIPKPSEFRYLQISIQEYTNHKRDTAYSNI